MGRRSVLVIEDDDEDLALIRLMLRRGQTDTDIRHAPGLDEGLQELRRQAPDVLLLDLRLPGVQGMDGLVQVREADPDVPVVIMTGVDDVKVSLEALRLGAQDYLVKGQASAEVLDRTLHHAVERARIEGHLKVGREGFAPAEVRLVLVPSDGAHEAVVRTTVQAARTGHVVLASWSRPPAILEKDLQEVDPQRIVLVDATGEGGATRLRCHRVGSPSLLEIVAMRVERACGELGMPLSVVLDHVNLVALYTTTAHTQEFIHLLANRMRALGASLDLLVLDNAEGRHLADLLAPYVDDVA